jgi:hypothetical protein
VAVFICVGGGWWTKPYWSTPVVAISSSGLWSANIVTGGNDKNAEAIMVILIPKGFNVPLASGDETLPDVLSGLLFAEILR